METQTKPVPHARTYLLRLWPVLQNEGIVWLAMLENAREDKPHAFHDIKALLTYLESECQLAEAEALTDTAQENVDLVLVETEAGETLAANERETSAGVTSPAKDVPPS
jgi:hypothetical protein